MKITVIVSTNPVNPADSHRRIEIDAPATLGGCVDQVISNKGAELTIKVNGEINDDLSTQLVGGEFVEIVVKAEYAQIAAWVVSYLGGAAAIGAVGVFIVNAIVYVGFTALVSGIVRHFSKKDSRGDDIEERVAYSVENGFNRVNEFGSIPRVMGRMRLYPDICMREFTELYIGPNDRDQVVLDEGDRSALIFPAPVFDPDTWVELANGYWYDTGPGAYSTLPPEAELIRPYPEPKWLYNPNAVSPSGPGQYMLVDHLVLSSNVWGEDGQVYPYFQEGQGGDDPGMIIDPPDITISWSTNATYDDPDRSQRMTVIFNAGWGDLNISEARIRDTNVEEYRGVTHVIGRQTQVGCELRGYPRSVVAPGGDADQSTTRFACDSRSNDYFPEAVVSEPGAGLRNNQEIRDNDEWWLERTSPRDTIHCQIDIAGNLHTFYGNPIGAQDVVFDIQFAQEGSGVWFAAPGSPLTISNGDTNLVQHPFSIDFPTPDYWDVRIRQVTPDSEDGNIKIEMQVSEFKFQRNVVAHYPAAGQTITTGGQITHAANTSIDNEEFDTRGQNRIGLVIQASEQLNGRVDRYDIIVSSHTWAWTAGATWNGETPPTGLNVTGNWQWGETSNPADWYINEALGGFLNSGKQIEPLIGRGWNLGPNPDNAEAIFGAGLDFEEINFEEIIAWRDYCEREGLTVNVFHTAVEPTYDTLHKIAAVGRASPTWQSGKLGVTWEEKFQPVTAMFNAGNMLINSLSIAYASEELPEAYRGTYTDATDNRFEQQKFTAKRPDLQGQTVINRVGQIDLWGVTDPVQARRAIRLEAARSLFNRRRITFRAGPEGFHTVRGDVILIAHDLTRWAISSRLVSIESSASIITKARLSKPQKWDGSGPLYAWVRHPSGVMHQGQVQAWTGENDDIEVIGDWWLTTDGPEATDQESGTGAGANNLGAEDFLIHIGPSETPGKKVRVIETTPLDDGGYEIIATDEYDGLWAHDIGDEESDLPTAWPESGEHIDVCARNCGVHKNDRDEWRVEWEPQGATAFSFSMSVDGSPWTPGQAVYGHSVVIPEYEPGTVLSVNVCPYVPAADESPYPAGAVPTEIYPGGCCSCRYVVPQTIEAC